MANVPGKPDNVTQLIPQQFKPTDFDHLMAGAIMNGQGRFSQVPLPRPRPDIDQPVPTDVTHTGEELQEQDEPKQGVALEDRPFRKTGTGAPRLHAGSSGSKRREHSR